MNHKDSDPNISPPLSILKEPTLSDKDKVAAWKQDFMWIETRNPNANADDDGHVGKTEYRCGICAKHGNWRYLEELAPLR